MFEHAEYRVEEDGGSMEACATILNSDGCIASTAITCLLTVRTSSDSAGTCMYMVLAKQKGGN